MAAQRALPMTTSDASPIGDIYDKLCIAAGAFFAVNAIALAIFSGWPPAHGPWLDFQHYLLGRDFINFWMAGRSIASGGPAPWFDYQAYNNALQKILGDEYPPTFWSYPPNIVLFVWPFGLLPYLTAYVAWCSIGIALYLFSCSSAVDRGRLKLLAFFPGIGVCIFIGQNGFYTAALLA